MTLYFCPRCYRVVEKPKGEYYCRVCGPSVAMWKLTLGHLLRWFDELERLKIDIEDRERLISEGYYDKRLKEIGAKIEELRARIDPLSELEMLLERTMKVMKTTKMEECPICGSKITLGGVERKYSDVRWAVGQLRDKLAKLLADRNRLYAELRELDEWKKRVREIETRLQELRKICPECLELAEAWKVRDKPKMERLFEEVKRKHPEFAETVG